MKKTERKEGTGKRYTEKRRKENEIMKNKKTDGGKEEP